jgi:hypothetical protein
MSKRKEEFSIVYDHLKKSQNAKDHNGELCLWINQNGFDGFDNVPHWIQEDTMHGDADLHEDYQPKQKTSMAQNVGTMVGGAAGTVGTALATGVVIWPLTKVAEMGVTAVYIAARVSFAGKRGLQDTAEFIKNSVNWMLGDKDAFNNIAKMEKLTDNVKTEMSKIGKLFDSSKNEDFKTKYLKYMADYDEASKKYFPPREIIELQKNLLVSLSEDKNQEFYNENKTAISGMLANIKKYKKLNHSVEEGYRRSDTNKNLTKILKVAEATVNKPLEKTIELTEVYADKSQKAAELLTPKKTPVRSRGSSSVSSVDF